MINRVVIPEDDFLGLDPSMKGPVVASTVFHIALFVLTAVGLPFVIKEHEIISQPISIEFVEMDKISQTKFVAPPEKEEKKEEPKPKQEKPAPPQVKTEAPPDLTKPKEPEIKEEDTKPPIEALAPPEPAKKPEVKKKPPEKKPDSTKVEKPKQQDDFASLLKNLTPDTPEKGDQKPLDPNAKASPQQSAIANISDRLTMSEVDALRHQLAQCWNVMAGAKFAENLVVEIRVVVSRERTVQQATILDQGRYNQDTHFRAAADAALRALRNPRCTPLALPPDKYEEWQTTVIRFDPSEML